MEQNSPTFPSFTRIWEKHARKFQVGEVHDFWFLPLFFAFLEQGKAGGLREIRVVPNKKCLQGFLLRIKLQLLVWVELKQTLQQTLFLVRKLIPLAFSVEHGGKEFHKVFLV